jgi:hypothetical protein
MVWMMALLPFLLLLASGGFLINLALHFLLSSDDQAVDIQLVEVVNHADFRPR